MKSQVAIDRFGCGLTVSDSQNRRCRTPHAIAACVDALHGNGAQVFFDEERPSLARHSFLFERTGLNLLSDGHDHHIARQRRLVAIGRHGRRPAPFDGTDNLGLHHKRNSFRRPSPLHSMRKGAIKSAIWHPSATAPSILFLRKRRHVRHASAIHHGHTIGPQADGCARSIHGNVAAANDADLLSAPIVWTALRHLPQELHSGHHAPSVTRPGMPTFLSP